MLEKVFQSRAGFSECLDPPCNASSTRRVSFNPVLGFLSVSTFEYETDDVIVLAAVETLRKPSTGLKLGDLGRVVDHEIVETLRKPSTGLKLPPSVWTVPDESSRHSENPARD